MMENISEESRSEFNDFEKKIFSNNEKIKYTQDNDIEAQVRYSYLCDEYDSNYVDMVLSEIGINKELLGDFDKYTEVLKKLNP